ncbi:histidine kinase [Nonlabens sp. YIK11]|uniref:histidine kinase n=1 Tax=Nonlabens sp. YIK11 TaxID=1453349 RepID=UPI000708538F|nr:histidine kinase [Nonlabens sp. YIK11]KQC33434.1 histidine kinase [Nonlabens sp. YIK11]
MKFNKLIRLILISILIGVGITLVNLFLSGFDTTLKDSLSNIGINSVFAFFLTFVNEALVDYLDRFLSWQKQPAWRLITGIIGSIIVTMVTLFFIIGFIQIVIYDVTVQEYLDKQSLEWYASGVIITLIITLIFHAFFFYKELQKSKIKEQKVIAGSATAQFDALKNQLDPHFLFNSLNVLVSLIEENPEAAVHFTTSLSKVYRYVLEQRGKGLVSLDEELAFARTYVRLLKMRFEDSLDISIPDGVSNPDLQMVPLSLQLLIENAVKHNTISDSQPLKLSIYEDGNQLVVENNLHEKAVVNNSTGVGLNNIASRYALLTAHQMTIEKTRDTFKVVLPLLDANNLQHSKSNLMEAKADDIRLVQAKEKVKDMKKFYDDAVRIIVILIFLGILNYFTSDYPWVIFPALGLGIGLFFQYMRSFDKNIFVNKSWQEKKIEELMNDKNF